MDIDTSAFTDERLPWSGRADELRNKRQGIALIGELGRNYDAYHEELAARVAKRGRPAPEQFQQLQDYLAAWSEVQMAVEAENLLRIAVALVNKQEVPQPADAPPLVSADDELLHIDAARELAKARARTAAAPAGG